MTGARRLFAILFVAATLHGQDWTPTHIEGISEYPRLAWIAQSQGDVSIKCTLDRDSSVIKIEALSGTGLLKDQALKNALLWKFRTIAPDGARIGGSITLTYRYRLRDEQQERQVTSFSVDLPFIVNINAS